MSIDFHAQVRIPRTLAEILRRAEAYIAAITHPPFEVLSPAIAPSELRLEKFAVPATVRDGRAYKESWTSWDRESIEIGAGPAARMGLGMAYTARADELDLPPDLIEMTRRFDGDRGYLAVAHVHRNRASFCLSLLVLAAVADLCGGRVEDDSGLLELGEWIEPAAVVALFTHHRDVTSFEALVDAFHDEMNIAPSWPRASRV